jgi:3',5'-cyclic AMP phosphodiesterase CpdA
MPPTMPPTTTPDGAPALLAISDLHVSHRDNRPVVETLRPGTPDDWLIVAGDVAERVDDVESVLAMLADRFATVIWSPGNHELWTTGRDPVRLRGVARYEHLVERCRRLGVRTPEDDYPVWRGPSGPLRIAPLFLLYDYSFRMAGAADTSEALAAARRARIVCTDEFLLQPDPYPSREAWCRARVELTERRLAACDPEIPLVLVNHWPLRREPTRVLRHPEFALWCGTELTADWHTRFHTAAMVYGHLHIPRITVHDGVPFQEVSLGYPREWRRRGLPEPLLRPVPALPDAHPAHRPSDRLGGMISNHSKYL